MEKVGKESPIFNIMGMIKIEPSWRNVLADEFTAPYFAQLTEFVRQEYAQTTCYPPGGQIFAAFDLCPFDQVKVVVIGQDPYHGAGQAEGLCFSVASGVRIPPSLRNIFKEVADDLQQPIATDGSLRHWAEQGVLLLNSTLTVREGKPGSHFGKGWEQFTNAVIDRVNRGRDHVVFLLWGRKAQEKAKNIDTQRHLVLTAAHPSPMALNHGGAFFGLHHFSQTNAYLVQHGLAPIQW